MANDQHLIPEDQVPSNLTPVEAPDIAPGLVPAPPMPTDMPTHFTGSIAPQLQHDGSFVGTEIGSPRIAKISLMPQSIQGNPNTNAGIQSTAIKVVQAAIAAIPAVVPVTDVESIGINKQIGTSYTLQPSDNDTLVTFDNNSGGAITLPSPGGAQTAGGTVSAFVDGSLSKSDFSGIVKLSLAAGSVSDLAITAFSGQADPLGTPSGWTSLFTGGTQTVVSKQQSGGAPITASATLSSGAQTWTSCMAAFRSSGATVITPRGAVSGALNNGLTLTLTGAITAGNALVLVLTSNGGPGVIDLVFGVTDTQGNPWKSAAAADNLYMTGSGAVSQHVQIWSTPIAATGTPTLTFSIHTSVGTIITAANIRVYEVSGLVSTGPVSNLPPFWYTYIQNTSSGTFGVGSLSTIDEISQIIQLPPNTGMLVIYDGANYYTNRGSLKTAFTFSDLLGTVSLTQGGTGTNLSATGGLHQFVAQLVAGGPFTVVQPDFNDLAGNSKAVKYNGVILAAAGLTSDIGTINITTGTLNVVPTTLTGVPIIGLHRISIYMIVSQAATVSSTLPDTQLIYTDQDSGASITVAATPSDNGNTLGTFLQATYVLNVKTGTLIQYAIGQVTPYASSGATPMQFAYHARDEFLG
jgi:hypothetical protein